MSWRSGTAAVGVLLGLMTVLSAGCSSKTTVKADGERVDFAVNTHPS